MGVVLPKPVVTRIYEREGADNWRVGSGSVNGFRENMEDAEVIFLRDNWAFFGVFDGHAGDKCSAYLHEEWHKRLLEEKMPISDERLKELALDIDLKFWKAGTDGGSTGTFFVAEVKGNTVHLQVGNVGDSRVLACKGGEPLSLTVDHKPNDPLEMRRIIECGGRVENNRVDGSLAVSRAFGDSDYKRGPGDQLHQKVIALADVTHCELTIGSDDFAVLACDGVFEGDFSNDQVIEYVKAQLVENQDLAAVGGNVCDEAIARGSKDNITCMVVQFRNGKDFAGKGLECAAGPWTNPDHAGFRKAYNFMANRGNLTVGECLMQRYDFLASKTRTDDEDSEWDNFKGGPPEGAMGADRTQWFSNYFEALSQETAMQGGGEHPALNTMAPDQVRRIRLLQQHLGIPMSMLMELMQNEGGEADGGEADDQPQ